MTYRAPVDDMAFALTHSAGMGRALDDGLYGDLGPDDVRSVLEEAGRFAGDVLAPLNRLGDQHGAFLKDGHVVLPPGWTYRLPEPVWGTERFMFFSTQPMHSDCERTEDEYGVLTTCGLPIDQLVSDGVLVEWWNIWLPTPPPPLPAGEPYAIGGREGVRDSEDVSDCGNLGATHAERITLPGSSYLRICARDPSDETLAELDALLQSIEFWGDEVEIPTHEAPPPSGSPLPCAASLIAGTLVRDDTYGVAIDVGEERVPVVWPYGYFAVEGPDGILVLDRHGTVRATEGERVELGGGMDAADERFFTCNY